MKEGFCLGSGLTSGFLVAEVSGFPLFALLRKPSLSELMLFSIFCEVMGLVWLGSVATFAVSTAVSVSVLVGSFGVAGVAFSKGIGTLLAYELLAIASKGPSELDSTGMNLSISFCVVVSVVGFSKLGFVSLFFFAFLDLETGGEEGGTCAKGDIESGTWVDLTGSGVVSGIGWGLGSSIG